MALLFIENNSVHKKTRLPGSLQFDDFKPKTICLI